MTPFCTNAIFQDGSKIPIKNIYCVGRNYREHALELNHPIPKTPLYFQKSIATISQTDAITIPQGTEIHHEVELVLCIKEDVFDSSELAMESIIAGYTIGLDLTDRTSQSELRAKGKPWFWAKSFRNSTVLGDFIPANDFSLNEPFKLVKNGDTVQVGHVSDMLFDIKTLLEKLVSRVLLLRGDIVFTGTPSGVGPLQSGDKLDIIHNNEKLYSVSIL